MDRDSSSDGNENEPKWHNDTPSRLTSRRLKLPQNVVIVFVLLFVATTFAYMAAVVAANKVHLSSVPPFPHHRGQLRRFFTSMTHLLLPRISATVRLVSEDLHHRFAISNSQIRRASPCCGLHKFVLDAYRWGGWRIIPKNRTTA